MIGPEASRCVFLELSVVTVLRLQNNEMSECVWEPGFAWYVPLTLMPQFYQNWL